ADDVGEFNLEHQRRPGRDHAAARTAVAVGEFRRDSQLPHLPDLHACNAPVPTGDDCAGAERELEMLASIPRAVELLAAVVGSLRVVQPARVMYDGRLPGLSGR